MTLERKLADAFQMDEQTWRSHANPLSGWSRVPLLPLFVLCIWSRIWLGWWVLLPMGLLLIWTWMNPRVFSRPKTKNAWMTKGVLGERFWLNRDRVPVPAHHRTVPHLLTTLSFVGVAVTAWGLYTLSIWPTVLGTVLALVAKFWFIDRMVWLYDDCQNKPEYNEWMSPAEPERHKRYKRNERYQRQ
jgi:hypothetical protein